MALKIFRKAKFKQRRQIKSRAHLATLPHIERGGCTGLSACWVERRLLNPTELAGARLASFNDDASWTRINDMARRFNGCTGGRAVRVHAIMPNIPGKEHGDAITINGQGDFQDLSSKLAESPGYYAIELTFKNGLINHLCVFYYGGGRLHFFDPNSGEYQVPQSMVNIFFRTLRTHYANYVSSDDGSKIKQEFESLYLIPIGV